MVPVPFDQLLDDYLRKAPRGTASRLAEALDIKAPNLSRYRRGKQVPDPRDADRWASLLGLDPDDVKASIELAANIRDQRAVRPKPPDHSHPEIEMLTRILLSLSQRLAAGSERDSRRKADAAAYEAEAAELRQVLEAEAERRRGSGSTGGAAR